MLPTLENRWKGKCDVIPATECKDFSFFAQKYQDFIFSLVQRPKRDLKPSETSYNFSWTINGTFKTERQCLVI
jgi:hypothetical protein